MISPELQSKLFAWRQKAAAGTLSIEEMREAIALLREGRSAAQTAGREAAASKRASSKAPARSADDLLSELGL